MNCRYSIRFPSTLIAAGLIVASGGASARAGFTFTGLGTLPGRIQSIANDISGDGSTVVGSSEDRAFYWTLETGMVAFGPPMTRAWATSADGSVIVGDTRSSDNPPPGFVSEAFRWTAQTGLVGLGDLPFGEFRSQARGVSSDGNIVVGRGDVTGVGAPVTHAFRWDGSVSPNPMEDIGPLVGVDSSAFAVSDDGNTIAGRIGSSEAMRWTPLTGVEGLGDLPGGMFLSQARGIAADGSVIVGRGASSLSVFDPFRWTAEEGMVGLGLAPGFNSGTAQDVSADGTVVVGGSGPNAGFIWDEINGMRDLRALLIAGGADLDGWSAIGANGISDDGSTIVGSGFHNGLAEAWIATVPEPGSFILLFFGAACSLRRRQQVS